MRIYTDWIKFTITTLLILGYRHDFPVLFNIAAGLSGGASVAYFIFMNFRLKGLKIDE
jgi:hypothetical protein